MHMRAHRYGHRAAIHGPLEHFDHLICVAERIFLIGRGRYGPPQQFCDVCRLDSYDYGLVGLEN